MIPTRDCAEVFVQLTLPEGRGPENHRRLSYRHILDPLELDELMIPDIPLPRLLTADSAVGFYEITKWQEKRERSRLMCEHIGRSIAFAIRKALIDNTR